MHLAIDAFLLFLSRINDHKTIQPHFTLIGSGLLDASIRRRVAMYTDIITIIPWIARNELPAHYQAADYMLYPSLESQGLVVSEAISQHCPVITLAGTGPAFITQQEDLTVHCDLNDKNACVKALANQLEKLYFLQVNGSIETARYRQVTAERAKDLSWDAIAKKTMLFYS